jgi:FkbM family methyltransferase
LQAVSRIVSGVRRKIYKTPQEKAFDAWFRDEGDKTLRLDYPLGPASVVFDVGGYEGQWASDIFSRYLCRIHVFEPVEAFAEKIKQRFIQNKSVLVHPFGLSDQTKQVGMAVASDRSSAYLSLPASSQSVKLVRFSEFVDNNRIERVDLLKVNIEGGEYDLLPHLLDTGLIRNISNLQVQFHSFVPDSERLMKSIQARLAITHALTYQYGFVWENWSRR